MVEPHKKFNFTVISLFFWLLAQCGITKAPESRFKEEGLHEELYEKFRVEQKKGALEEESSSQKELP